MADVNSDKLLPQTGTLLTTQEEARRANTEYVPQSATKSVKETEQNTAFNDDDGDDILAQVEEQFRRKYGRGIDEIIGLAQQGTTEEPPATTEEVSADTFTSSLIKEWGVDEKEASRRLNIVLQEFQKLPAEEQPLYDSMQGAKALWAKYEKSNTPVQMDKGLSSSVSASQQSGFMFTAEQISGMSDKERRAYHQQIVSAYATGKVHRN